MSKSKVPLSGQACFPYYEKTREEVGRSAFSFHGNEAFHFLSQIRSHDGRLVVVHSRVPGTHSAIRRREKGRGLLRREEDAIIMLNPC